MSDEMRAEPQHRHELPPPRWPRRRTAGPWDRSVEEFPGELALNDLEDAPADDAIAILARHAVIRCLAETATGRRGSIRSARRAARLYLDATPDADARPLRRLLHRRTRTPSSIHHALLDAGLAARDARHMGGAYTLFRWAYEVARLERRRGHAGSVAAGLAALALAAGAPGTARRWTRRVHALVGDDGVPGALSSAYVQGMEKTPSAGGAYDAAQRRHIAGSIASGIVPACPACQAPLTTSEVRPPRGVPYVRRRVWVLCTGCRRTAALDVPGRPPASP